MTDSIQCTISGGRDGVCIQKSVEVRTDQNGYLSSLSKRLQTLQSEINSDLSTLVDKEKAGVGVANGRSQNEDGTNFHEKYYVWSESIFPLSLSLPVDSAADMMTVRKTKTRLLREWRDDQSSVHVLPQKQLIFNQQLFSRHKCMYLHLTDTK